MELSNSTNLKLSAVSSQLNVSDATVRNWIKTGYLKRDVNGLIDKNSYTRFVDDIVGCQKLNSRANKSQKDFHDHQEVTLEIQKKILKGGFLDDTIYSEYENSLSNSYRNKEGIYYTPRDIVDDMLPSSHPLDFKYKKFCDPCCGSGNFVMRAIDMGFKPSNVYGFDTDPIAVSMTKHRILKKTGYCTDHVVQGDFLEYASNTSTKFDYIYTNPPWGKKMPKKHRELYANTFGSKKSLDTSALFFLASLNLLNENGSLGFLLPESFFNIATFEDVRKKALEFLIVRLHDYGQPFNSVLARAQSIVLLKNKISNSNAQCRIKDVRFRRTTHSFKKMPNSIINFHVNQQQADLIEHVYSMNHTTLSGRVLWGLGIVTGNNREFIKGTFERGLMPVFRGSDINYGKLKEPSSYIPKDLSLYQQVAPVELYEAPEKLIYRFISSKLCFFMDVRQRYILNSANMIVPLNNLPLSLTDIVDLLNSEFMNWLFTSIFRTHKVLKRDVESLPIHVDFFKKNKKFTEDDYLDFLKVEKVKHGTYRIKK